MPGGKTYGTGPHTVSLCQGTRAQHVHHRHRHQDPSLTRTSIRTPFKKKQGPLKRRHVRLLRFARRVTSTKPPWHHRRTRSGGVSASAVTAAGKFKKKRSVPPLTPEEGALPPLPPRSCLGLREAAPSLSEESSLAHERRTRTSSSSQGRL